jgi:hypothetical protein
MKAVNDGRAGAGVDGDASDGQLSDNVEVRGGGK